ncbi:hypothetical protein XpopCFBP1817_13160 [Xanthomonas populi]|uniref:Uncharacterized protein n=1 Tax=Xanthomonas populi TaxID=53414 RepID=A0A2S7EMK0_9XANT|nr:hypothetical protein XpopCFBP1817_13160 [Xanthomonas populi]
MPPAVGTLFDERNTAEGHADIDQILRKLHHVISSAICEGLRRTESHAERKRSEFMQARVDRAPWHQFVVPTERDMRHDKRMLPRVEPLSDGLDWTAAVLRQKSVSCRRICQNVDDGRARAGSLTIARCA